MKIFTFLFLFLFYSSVFSQNAFPESGENGNGELSGNVGIGTSNPTSLLSLLADQPNLSIRRSSSWPNPLPLPHPVINLAIAHTSSVYSNFANANNVVLRGRNSGQFIITNDGGGDIVFGTSPSGIQLNEDVERLRITNLGNIGVGIDNPTELFEVNGKIRAKEVKVTLDNWPDYVFKENYNLISPSEIEAFINENGHLPKIPSASEVVENGLELGKMNKLMMEKIEELTLYIIEQEKRIEALENKLN